MGKQRPLEVITPPNMLRVKVGGKVGLDASAIERAEAALQSMSGEFAQWLDQEVANLGEAWSKARDEGLNAETRELLHRRAHDLKGLGATYGYPIISRIAGLLCRLLESGLANGEDPMPLVGAHVQAIRASVRDEVKSEEDPVGRALVTELEDRVTQIADAA